MTMGRVALDGRKVADNAALDQSRTLRDIERAVRRLLEEAGRVDRAEDQQYGPDRRGNELPEALCTQVGRLARLQEATQRLQADARQAARRVSAAGRRDGS